MISRSGLFLVYKRARFHEILYFHLLKTIILKYLTRGYTTEFSSRRVKAKNSQKTEKTT